MQLEDESAVATTYVQTELARTRALLQKTQITSACMVILFGGYFGYLTTRFTNALEPTEAATIANGLISQKVDEQATQLADYAKREVPHLISQAPDYAITNLPVYRKDIEAKIDAQFVAFAESTREQFSQSVDKFLEDNKEGVGQMIRDGQDPAKSREMVAHMNTLFREHLEMPIAGGESIQAKLDATLESLDKVDQRIKHLASNKKLAPSEKSARRAIAVLLKTIEDKKADEGHDGPLIMTTAKL